MLTELSWCFLSSLSLCFWGQFLRDASFHVQSWTSILRQLLMAPLGHAPFLDFSKKSFWKCSKVHFHTLIRLTYLLHRMDADNGMAGHSRVRRNSTFISDSTVAAWNIPPPTRCLVSQGRQFCSPLVSPSEQLQETRCQRTDEHVLLPRSCQLPLEQAVWYLHQRYTQTSSFSKGASLPFSTCWAWA